jgi:hypothetical protein
MPPMRATGIAIAVAGALLLPGMAHATATPLSPANGANVGTNIHPSFQWALPPGEKSSLLRVASKPNVTPEGKFLTENIEQSHSFSTGAETAYTAEQPLAAGPHWWTIDSYRTSPFTEYVSAPLGFTIAASIGKPKIKITRYRFIRKLGVDVRITGNIPTALVRIKAYKGRKVVGKASERRTRYLVTTPSTSFITLKIHKRRARKLKVVVSVSYGKTKAVRRKTIRGV